MEIETTVDLLQAESKVGLASIKSDIIMRNSIKTWHVMVDIAVSWQSEREMMNCLIVNILLRV